MDQFSLLALTVALAAVGLLVLYNVIVAAVRRALRDHQEWLDERAHPER